MVEIEVVNRSGASTMSEPQRTSSALFSEPKESMRASLAFISSGQRRSAR